MLQRDTNVSTRARARAAVHLFAVDVKGLDAVQYTHVEAGGTAAQTERRARGGHPACAKEARCGGAAGGQAARLTYKDPR